MILRDLYTTLLRGSLDNVFEDENLRLINERTTVLLNKQNWTIHDIDDADMILRISNILYNNTDLAVLPLEDGVYDLLLECRSYYILSEGNQ